MARTLNTRTVFVAAYLLLGVAAGAAIGAAVVLAQRPGPTPPPPWSSWRPASSSVKDQVLQIADHVGRSYRLPSGDQLVAIKVGGAQGGASPNVNGVAVVKKGAPQTLDQEYGKDETAVYILCGSTKSCAINEGQPSVARGTVLRREALELALYTLEYAHPIDNVLVFFPPDRGQKSLTSTLFFRRDDLSNHLKTPLRKTLPQKSPPISGRIAPQEKKTVDDLTGTKLYRYLGIGQNLIVIQPAA